MAALVSIARPILLSAMNSCQVKRLVCELLDRYVTTTDNDIDNLIAKMVREALLRECV